MMTGRLFRFSLIRKAINDGTEFVNTVTNEYVFKDEQFDTEEAWRDRGVWNVCCKSRVPYDPRYDEDIDIDEVAMRIATEGGWMEA